MGLISNIQEKLSGNKDKDHTEEVVDSSRSHDTTTGGLTGQGSHLQQHTGANDYSHPTSGTTATSNNPLASNAATHGSSGITGGSHPLVGGNDSTTTEPGLGNNIHSNTDYGHGEGSHLAGATGQHSNTGLTGTQHSGSGLTGTSHSGSGLTGTSHSGSSLTGTSQTGQGLTNNTHHNTHSGTQDQRSVDFVPGSHPNANNHSAIPTAGGQKVGGVGETGYSGTDAGVHQTVGDKVKNALPGQQRNAHDAHGNSINSSSTGPTGPHTTSSHTTSGLTGSNTTHNTQSGSGFSSSAQPLSHDSSFNDRHSGPGVGTGLAAGAVGGAGLASADHHHNTHNQTHSSATTGAHSGVVGEDNRGVMDKVKDTLSSKRTNRPDDPITGTNYDQKNRDQYTQGTHGSGLTGSSHGNYAQTSQKPGVVGITRGVDQTHIGSDTHSGAHSSGLGQSHGVSHEGRSAEWKEGYAAGYREATLSLGSHSSTTSTHSTTGQHSGSHIGSTGTHSSTGHTDNTKPSLMDKLNPKKDADRDGKAGIMD